MEEVAHGRVAGIAGEHARQMDSSLRHPPPGREIRYGSVFGRLDAQNLKVQQLTEVLGR